MVAAVVDDDLGYQLRGRGVIDSLRHAGLVGSWYLNGPADGTDSAEDVGCDWDVHGTARSTLGRSILCDSSSDNPLVSSSFWIPQTSSI